MIDKELLKFLVCPEDRTPLSLADDVLIDRINRAIDAGNLTSRVGQVVDSRLEGGLIRQDEQIIYPIVEGIPILLVDQAIEVAKLDE